MSAVRVSLRGVIRTSLVFLLTYMVLLFVWIRVKDYYAVGVTTVASHLIEGLMEVSVGEIRREGGDMVVSFLPERYRTRALIEIVVKTSVYTFNTPLSVAIMACFYPYLRSRHRRLYRVYLEALLLLLLVHLLYVFSLEGESVRSGMVRLGYKSREFMSIFFWQFLWQFTDNMIVRFEPFLLGAYLYLRRPLK